MLELRQVVKRYRDGEQQVSAIAGVSLTVDAGEMVAVHGPSGSGKTTLLMLIAGLLKPDEGSIRDAGRELGELSDDQVSDRLLHEVGVVSQSLHLLPKVSALENAAVKLMLAGVGMRAAKRRAEEYLERLGLAGHVQRTPEQLSGGERQRVAIARALACEPRLVLADEPTGALDSRRSLEVIELLGEIAHQPGRAVVLVTHDTEASALADREWTLRDGRLHPDPPQGDDELTLANAGEERPVSVPRPA